MDELQLMAAVTAARPGFTASEVASFSIELLGAAGRDVTALRSASQRASYVEAVKSIGPNGEGLAEQFPDWAGSQWQVRELKITHVHRPRSHAGNPINKIAIRYEVPAAWRKKPNDPGYSDLWTDWEGTWQVNEIARTALTLLGQTVRLWWRSYTIEGQEAKGRELVWLEAIGGTTDDTLDIQPLDGVPDAPTSSPNLDRPISRAEETPVRNDAQEIVDDLKDLIGKLQPEFLTRLKELRATFGLPEMMSEYTSHQATQMSDAATSLLNEQMQRDGEEPF